MMHDFDVMDYPAYRCLACRLPLASNYAIDYPECLPDLFTSEDKTFLKELHIGEEKSNG